jgi:hypothetical protein
MSNDKAAATFHGSGWAAGMTGGVWEYMTTDDGQIFYDVGEAQRHFFHDLDSFGQIRVRPFGETEWGWHMSGKTR